MDEAMPPDINDRLRIKYRRVAAVLLVFAIVFTVWTIVVIVSVFSMGASIRWAELSPTEWVAANIIVVAIFLFVNLILYGRYRIKVGIQPGETRDKRRRLRKEAPTPEMIKGHQVYTLTLPNGAKGGIFSKTFIPIDETRVLQLRYQMIPPTMLWPPKE